MPTVCLVGVSGFASVHFEELVRHHGQGLIRLAAATVINQDQEPEKCARLTAIGCIVFPSFEAMLAAQTGRADLCVIPTGIPLHEPMVRAALAARMHALVEKPFTGTLAEAHAMIAAARAADRQIFVGFQNLYATETLRMKRAVLDGRLGPIREVVSWALWPRGPEYYARNGWAGRLQSGGKTVLDSPFNNALAHQLNTILFLAGPDEQRSAGVTSVRAELYRARPIDSCDTAAFIASTDTGIPCRFLCSHASADNIHPIIEIRGEAGTLRWEFQRKVLLRYRDGREESWPIDPTVRDRMHAAVRERIAGGTAFVCTPDHAIEHTRAVNLAHACGPIHTIDAKHLGPGNAIVGIAEALTRTAAAEGRLFHDEGLPWTLLPGTRSAHPDPTISELLGTPASRA